MRRFVRYNPITITAHTAAVLTVSMFCMDPIILSLSLFGAWLSMALYTDRRRGVHVMALVTFLLTVIINPLVSHAGQTVLFMMNDMPVTLESVIYGAVAGEMLACAMYWFYIFSSMMTSDKLLYLFGALSPKTALVLSMALGMIPRFAKQFSRVQQAQKVIGRYNDDTVVDDVRGRVAVFSAVTTWALENGIVTADSMAARGYGIKQRSRFSLFRFRVVDGAVCVICVLLAVLSLIGLHGTPTVFYPQFLITPLTPVALIGYGSFGVLVLMPLFMEGGEKAKWIYLHSKM